jgi:hypothetical protein
MISKVSTTSAFLVHKYFKATFHSPCNCLGRSRSKHHNNELRCEIRSTRRPLPMMDGYSPMFCTDCRKFAVSMFVLIFHLGAVLTLSTWVMTLTSSTQVLFISSGNKLCKSLPPTAQISSPSRCHQYEHFFEPDVASIICKYSFSASSHQTPTPLQSAKLE